MAKEREAPPSYLEDVRAFVNTFGLEDGTDQLSSARALVRWLAEHGLISPATRAGRPDLEHALELREALRAALLANNTGGQIPAQACAALDRAADRALLRPRVATDGTSTLSPAATGVDGALGRLLAVVHRAVAEGTWGRLKVCRDDACQWAYYDTTKNHARSWCSMAACGNRAKARAYRKRQSAGAATEATGQDSVTRGA